MKDTGKKFKGVPIFEAPEAPHGQLYMLNSLPPRRNATLSPIDVDPENVGFKDIHYKGKPVTRDGLDGLGDLVDDGVSTAYYQHIYKSTFLGLRSYDETSGRHMCFQWGAWCWKQAREHPIEAVKYLLKRRLPR